MKITEVLITPQEIAWLPWAAQYFFYIGGAYAASILFLIALIWREKTSHLLRTSLVLTMAISAIVGALALSADLHQPARAWHFYAHFTPWSWMSLGSIFLPLFCALSVITAWLYLRDDLVAIRNSPNQALKFVGHLSFGSWKTTHRQLLFVALVTMLSGLSIALYTGAEVAVIKARPLWNQSASPLLWFVTAFLSAIGFSLILCLLQAGKRLRTTFNPCDMLLITRTLKVTGVLAIILLSIWASNDPMFHVYSQPTWFYYLMALYLLFVLCALLPTSTTLLPKSLSGTILTAAMTLGAAWMTRWVTLMETQRIAKYDAGLYPYELPVGTAGYLGILGMLGLWCTFALITSELTRVQHSHQNPSSLANEQFER
ncbi:NrfD/PsrC family molybdoenzyme membrane anchor subunit [Vibrio hangzhouensis]|uniref:Tetrathionate reductase gamma subunit n=1 Tax=Vibrio hangzhouensis TaxID=462991 RepID=A0A1H6C4P4_9VIBR|nr:NrfD/PsrC family molybdoenzyme membrane anchor subunit [Vibrio hangzhouensis]SEG67931.1 tetrathionate reductase gamma subunit [Vibrio hangzhouensis]